MLYPENAKKYTVNIIYLFPDIRKLIIQSPNYSLLEDGLFIIRSTFNDYPYFAGRTDESRAYRKIRRFCILLSNVLYLGKPRVL